MIPIRFRRYLSAFNHRVLSLPGCRSVRFCANEIFPIVCQYGIFPSFTYVCYCFNTLKRKWHVDEKFRHYLQQKLPFCQLPLQPMTKIWTWHFTFSDRSYWNTMLQASVSDAIWSHNNVLNCCFSPRWRIIHIISSTIASYKNLRRVWFELLIYMLLLWLHCHVIYRLCYSGIQPILN